MVWSTFDELIGLSKLHLFRYDYAFFYYAFQVALHHQSFNDLYNLNKEQTFVLRHHFLYNPNNQYVYPPQFAFIASFFGHFPFALSADLWMSISVFCYGLGISLFAKMLWPTIQKKSIFLLILALSILTPFQIDIGAGNVNSILFACFALTFYLLYVKNKQIFAGIPLGLAIVFKITPAAILLYLLLRKKWLTSFSALITCGILTGITMLRFGADSMIQYVTQFMHFGQTSMRNGPAPYNQSIIGVIGTFVHHHWIHFSTNPETSIFPIYLVIISVFIGMVILQKSVDWKLDISMASLCPLLFSPLIEEMHMIFVLPTMLILSERMIALYRVKKESVGMTPAILSIALGSSYLILSLPFTFLLNIIVKSWPTLFWVHTQMFWVLMILFFTTVWQALRYQASLSSRSKQMLSRQFFDWSS